MTDRVYPERSRGATFRPPERCPTCGAGPDELHDPHAHDPAFDARMHVAVRQLTELELLKIIAVNAAVVVLLIENLPPVVEFPVLARAAGELAEALDRLDEFKRHEREQHNA
jgi:hypothetical protein